MVRPTIIVDTREQRPYGFSDRVAVERGALPAGDYSLRGLEHVVTVERKTLSDLLGSLTRERPRFERELRTLQRYRFAAVIVETDWPTIVAGLYPQQIAPSALVGSLMAFASRYHVIPIPAGDRATAAELVERLLVTFARQVEREYKSMTEASKALEVVETVTA